MLGWIPLLLAIFALLPARRAVLAGFVLGWLFLPNAEFALAGLPDYTKTSATSLGCLLGALVFNGGRLLALRPRLMDVPMMVWVGCPFITSLSNGLGPYDGVSAVAEQAVVWGVPYLLGRAYVSDLAGLREMAVALVLAGLVYVPLCLFEIRMSPQLHRIFYGFHPHEFVQHIRYGGYRPMVFMQHGLMVATLMGTADAARAVPLARPLPDARVARAAGAAGGRPGGGDRAV